MVSIDTTVKDMYIVWVYGEDCMLTNVLRALAVYKRKVGGYWPREAALQRNNRLSFGIGEDTRVTRNDQTLVDAMYLSTYRPLPDDCDDDEQEATVLDVKRKPVGKAFRDR